MPTDNVVGLFGLTNEEALTTIRAVVRNSSRVAFTDHAKTRMMQRGITRQQVMACLPRARIVDEPYRTPKGNWKMKVEGQAAGDWIQVVLCLDSDSHGNKIIVITVIDQ